ncbi:MAG: ATP synthase subunit I [Deltaproteobacteria bacterium]|jgi:hypothetical protein|nr:ATP synthase subunit I [Deltaproteobacteria bacterium]
MTARDYTKLMGLLVRSGTYLVVFCLALTIGLAVGLGLWKGASWALGAFLGGGLVVGNAFLLRRALATAKPGRLDKSFWWSVAYFYLAFFITALICFVVIKYQIGNSLAFILGLSTFILAAFITTMIGLVGHLIQASSFDDQSQPGTASEAPASEALTAPNPLSAKDPESSKDPEEPKDPIPSPTEPA